jgi:hypothetical protein
MNLRTTATTNESVSRRRDQKTIYFMASKKQNESVLRIILDEKHPNDRALYRRSNGRRQ